MRNALAKFGGPMRRRFARDHTADEARGLVSNEQQPEVELDIVAAKPEVVNPPGDRPGKERTIFVKLRNVRRSFRRRKSTSGSDRDGERDRKKNKTTPEVNSTPSPATSCSGLFETDVDRLIELDEPEVEISITDDVTSAEAPSSSAAILHAKKSEEEETVGDGEKVERSRRVLNEKNFEREEAAIGPEADDVTTSPADDDDVTRQHGDCKKHRKKRKQAKRYAKRVCIFSGKMN